MIGGGAVGDKSLGGLFVLGIIAGLVTFGGAYTTLPFIFTAAVQNNGWLSQQVFLDAIAITNTLPTPLVSFVVLPGFYANGIAGAIIICIGIFVPAFSFTIIGHEIFETVMENKFVEPFLDGVGVGVIGLLLQTCFLFLRAAVISPVDACIFYLALQASFHFTDKYTQPLILITAAIAGQALYA
jgi:chromate transporter